MISILNLSDDRKKTFNLIIDDIIYDDHDVCNVSDLYRSNEIFYVWIYEHKICELVTKKTFNDISHEIKKLSLHLPMKDLDLIYSIEIIRNYNEDNSFEIAFEFRFDFENWNRPWSIAEYSKAMEDAVTQTNRNYIQWKQDDEEFITNGCHLIFKVNDIHKNLLTLIENSNKHLLEIHNYAVSSLLTQIRQNTVISYFVFSDLVRVPCEQYLLYFTKFLSDLGIEASADMQHEAGQLLFSVTPTAEKDALDTIYQALQLYLQLPSNDIISNYIQFPSEPRVQQLVANIHHLHGQLALVNALVQAKDQTIHSQTLIIEEQKKIINATILQDSLRFIATNKKIDDKESILGGAVNLTKLKGKGFEIDIPHIFREIKKFLGT